MVERLKINEAVPKMGRDTFEIGTLNINVFNTLQYLKVLLSRPKNGTGHFSDGTPNTLISYILPTQIAYLSHFYRDT
jgi:hypothetical protein